MPRDAPVMVIIKVLEKAKETLKQKGHQYYETERTATLVFWELENIVDKMLKTLKEVEG